MSSAGASPPATEADTGSEIEEKLAPLYRVICHDDPITTMDFVVEIPRGIFKVPHAGAVRLMMEVHTCTFSPDGRTIYTASNGGHVCFFDPTTGERRHTLRRKFGLLLAMCASPDNTMLAANERGTVWVIPNPDLPDDDDQQHEDDF